MKISDINLMDDNQNEWGDEDPDCNRFRVRHIVIQLHMTMMSTSTTSSLKYGASEMEM